VHGARCWCRVLGACGAECYVPGAWCLVPGAWCLVLGAWYWLLGAGCWVLMGGLVRGLLLVSVMGVRRFEELDAWKLADELKKRVYALLDRGDARRDRRFCEQIMESAASSPANLAEGFGYYRHPDFARYARIAKASLTETQNHLRDGVDRQFWTPADVDPLLHLANRSIGACVRLIAYLETSDAPGVERKGSLKRSSTFPKR